MTPGEKLYIAVAPPAANSWRFLPEAVQRRWEADAGAPAQTPYPQKNTARVVIGVDPGKSGGIAAICGNTSMAFGFETTDMLEAVNSIIGKDDQPNAVAYLEEVGGYVGMRQPGSAMFTFGHAAGRILGILEARGVAVRYVKPQEWQKGISGVAGARQATKKQALLDGKDDAGARRKAKSAGKKELVAEARRRFPSIKVTAQNADALLIADYGMRLERGATQPTPDA